jgi:hypothetical protein
MSTIRFITQLNYKLCETDFEERYVIARKVVYHYFNLTYKTAL